MAERFKIIFLRHKSSYYLLPFLFKIYIHMLVWQVLNELSTLQCLASEFYVYVYIYIEKKSELLFSLFLYLRLLSCFPAPLTRPLEYNSTYRIRDWGLIFFHSLQGLPWGLLLPPFLPHALAWPLQAPVPLPQLLEIPRWDSSRVARHA